MKTLSILIPVYNEEKTILDILKKVKRAPTGKIKKEIVVVDDGSTDNTFALLLKQKGIKLIKHKKNRGKGAAIRTALSHAKGDIMIIQDADLEYNPNEYSKLMKPILEGDAKVVYGSRNLYRSNNLHSTTLFYIGGVGLTIASRILYPSLKITDESTCYKMLSANLMRSLNLRSNGFELCPEITAKLAKKGILIKEIPISYNPRSPADGKKIKLIDGFKALYYLIYYRIFN